jgi:lipopolysaccharide biosynthesis regulator YciM
MPDAGSDNPASFIRMIAARILEFAVVWLMAKRGKRSHTDTTLKLPSDFSATVKALLNTRPPPTADEISRVKSPKRRTRREKRR